MHLYRIRLQDDSTSLQFPTLAGCQSSDVIQVCTISFAHLPGITIEFR